jgi:hypothetical protein
MWNGVDPKGFNQVAGRTLVSVDHDKVDGFLVFLLDGVQGGSGELAIFAPLWVRKAGKPAE